ESDAVRGRAALRFTLAALRAALGDPEAHPHVQITRESVSFDPTSEVELDLSRLEAAAHQPVGPDLKEAVSAWRGGFMDGFSLTDAPAFDEWLSFQRERWHILAEVAFESYALACSPTEGADVAQRWVAMSPLNESAHRQLMRHHAAMGHTAAALRAYQTCRAV